MTEQVVPITGLNAVGLVKDTPAIALPTNAFSDVLNVRFNNGCVEKIPGEAKLFSSFTGDAIVGSLIHIAWWANPNLTPTNGYYVVVATDTTTDRVYIVRASDGNTKDLELDVPTGGNWQHTVYQGGYAIIINNGLARPWYILDSTGNTDMALLDAFELPGWDSYFTNEVAFNDIYNSDIHVAEFDLGKRVNFDLEEVVVSVYSGTDNSKKFSVILTSVTTVAQATSSLDPVTNTHLVTVATAAGGNPAFTEFLQSGDTVYVTVRSIAIVQVRAGVIRSWGDTLVAGNLIEINSPPVASVNDVNNTLAFTSRHGLSVGDVLNISSPSFAKGKYTVSAVGSDTQVTVNNLPTGTYTSTRYTILSSGTAVRNQPGVVRISDVAAAGAIPHNWNPYSAGVSTAEEFTLSTTGIIQELAAMQGNLYVYTNNSIHALSKTSNPSIPYVASIVSSTHGASGLDLVHEHRGTHVVVGSDDIYQFSGHPASIKSLSNNRVRDYYFKNVSPSYSTKAFILNNTADDELWICFPNLTSTGNTNEILIFNYEDNVWSRRVISEAAHGISGHTKDVLVNGSLSANVDPSVSRPIFVLSGDIYGVDFNNKYTDINNVNYESYIERTEAPMSPEFDVESLSSVALWASKDVSDDINLRLRFRTTNAPGASLALNPLTGNGTVGDSENPLFIIGKDYKTDARLNGRLLNFRFTDESNVSNNWRLSGFQLEVKKGGRR
tara:strand:- start:4378 stop:6543 length:2166 start_codon:yes stop_codon:yes gene_type:complete